MGGKESQVKIRSHRIEVGEIEEALEEHAGIGEAVVVAREEEGGGEKRLVAYYRVVEGEGTELGAEELRKYLSGSWRSTWFRRGMCGWRSCRGVGMGRWIGRHCRRRREKPMGARV